MLYVVAKNFLFSMNSVVLVACLYLFYKYIHKRNLIKYHVFRMIDRIA